MGVKLVDLPDWLEKRRTSFSPPDDFHWYVTAHNWTSLAADSGTSVTISTATGLAAGGWLLLTPGTTDNNEVAAYSTNKVTLFAADKPALFETRINFTEANTSAMNCCVGWASAFGANLMVDDGAGMATNFSGAMIFKVDGGTVWKCISSIGTTQTVSTSTVTAGGGTQVLRIEFHPLTSTTGDFVFLCDSGSGLKPFLDSNNREIKHTAVTITSAATMNYGMYCKQGSTSADLLYVDYAYNAQLH